MAGLKNRLTGSMAIAVVLVLALLLAMEVGFLLYRPAHFTPTPPYGSLNILSGAVKVQPPDAIAWKEAGNGMSIISSSRLKTTGDSHALLTFSGGTTTKLEPGTDLLVVNLENGADKQPGAVVLKQLSGKTWNQVVKAPDNSPHFEIQTSSATVKVRGTLFLTDVDKSGRTIVQTAEGQVSVSAQGKEVIVSAGEQTIVEPGAPPSSPTPIPEPPSELLITVSAPAIGTVVDPTGSSVGHLPDGTALNQIAGARSSMTAETQHIGIPQPVSGEYILVLRGAAEGESQVSIEGRRTGESVSRYVDTSNVTGVGEQLLRLHVEVLDGLLKGVAIVNPALPGSQATSANATGGSTGATEKTQDNGSEKHIMGRALDAGRRWLSEQDGYQFNMSATSTMLTVIIIAVGAGLALILKKFSG